MSRPGSRGSYTRSQFVRQLGPAGSKLTPSQVDRALAKANSERRARRSKPGSRGSRPRSGVALAAKAAREILEDEIAGLEKARGSDAGSTAIEGETTAQRLMRRRRREDNPNPFAVPKAAKVVREGR